MVDEELLISKIDNPSQELKFLEYMVPGIDKLLITHRISQATPVYLGSMKIYLVSQQQVVFLKC